MPIFLKGKSKYVKNMIDGSEHCLTTGHFLKFLQSKGIKSVTDYVLQYECPAIRPVCAVCGKHAKQEGLNGVEWKFASTCGDKDCATEQRRRGRKAVTKEQEAESIRKRNATFAKEPERFENMQRAAHEANLLTGEDGLTGYERTAVKRKATLLEKHGREDYANWAKTSETWANKSDEEIKVHGDKIRESWANKSDEEKRDEIERREKIKLVKYGKPGWKIAYDASGGRRSAIAEEFCCNVQASAATIWLIFGQHEFSLNGKYFDLTAPDKKKIVEFNGDYWHANPNKYANHDIMRNGKTAAEIWEADAKKIAMAESHGYRVKVVWESDYKKNPKKVIEECMNWLKH